MMFPPDNDQHRSPPASSKRAAEDFTSFYRRFLPFGILFLRGLGADREEGMALTQQALVAVKKQIFESSSAEKSEQSAFFYAVLLDNFLERRRWRPFVNGALSQKKQPRLLITSRERIRQLQQPDYRQSVIDILQAHLKNRSWQQTEEVYYHPADGQVTGEPLPPPHPTED